MAEERVPELKITVQNDGSVEAEVPNQTVTDGRLDDDLLLLETLTTFRDWINQGRLTIESERELRLLGSLLYRLLFGRSSGPKIQNLVYSRLRAAQEKHERVCIQLAFKDGQSELAGLPWEFLYSDENKSFLATTSDLILTRFVNTSRERQALLTNTLPLRLLVVVSTKGGKTVAYQNVVETIQDFAKKHPDQLELNEPLIDPSPLDLQEWFERRENAALPPHIIHFIAHGRYNKAKNQGEIALTKQDDPTDADWVDHDRFQQIFTNSGCIPRLVFLQLCEGAVIKGGELIAGFEGLAPALIGANVQAVVAMQFPIKNVHAGRLARKFYDELTKGTTVGEAVQAARRTIFTFDPVAGGTPVLYMYGYDGAVVGKAATPATAESKLPLSALTLAPVDSALQPGPASKEPRRPAAPEPPTPPPSGPAVTVTELALAKALDAGSRRIQSLSPCTGAQGFQAAGTPKLILSLNLSLHQEVIPALRDKTIPEMRQVLADRWGTCVGTPMCDVLHAMFVALEGLS